MFTFIFLTTFSFIWALKMIPLFRRVTIWIKHHYVKNVVIFGSKALKRTSCIKQIPILKYDRSVFLDRRTLDTFSMHSKWLMAKTVITICGHEACACYPILIKFTSDLHFVFQTEFLFANPQMKEIFFFLISGVKMTPWSVSCFYGTPL